MTRYKTPFIFYSAAFSIPAAIMATVLATRGIYWGSPTTILASDGFHQYGIFATQLSNILHGSDSIFYTFTSGLGLNFYALSSYYLGSFLSPFYALFTVTSMADAVYLFTLIKFGLIGLSMSFTLKRIFVNLQKLPVIFLASSYALMSFAVSQLEINNWLDVFILSPLIVLGLHQLLEGKRLWLYYLTLSLLLIQNYYFGFMLAIFLTLYFLAQVTRDFSWKRLVRKFTDFTLVSLSSGLTAAIMLLPSYLDLSTHGEKFSSFERLLTEKSWYLDIFAKNFVGSYDTTKFGALPMIYVGLLPLILALLFFFQKSIKWQVKLAYFLLLAFFLASFYLNPLDLLWQGMHSPNMFLHRYAWLLSLLVVLMAAESLTHFETYSPIRLSLAFLIFTLPFILTLIYRNHYPFLKPVHLILTFAFIFAYAVILISYRTKQLGQQAFLVFLAIFALFEIGLNTYYQVNGLGDEWVFPSREGYARDSQAITKLVKASKQQETSFFRTERLLPQTGNDSMKFNYNGISQFSSIRNRDASSSLDRLGFQSSGTNLNLRYQNNTIIADSLFGITYNLSSEPIDKFGFRQVDSAGSLGLYKNDYASQLAILTDGPYKNLDFSINTLDNQAALLNALSGLDQHYFTRLLNQVQDYPASQTNSSTRLNLAAGDQSDTASITYHVTVPAHQQVYVSVPNIYHSNRDANTVIATVNGRNYHYTLDNAYSFFNLGYFDRETQLEVKLSFPQSKNVSFDKPSFYGLDTLAYQKAMQQIQAKKVTVRTKGRRVKASYTSSKKASLFFTLPYDKGWTAKVNGKKVPIKKAQKGFMLVDVPAGKGEVVLSFLPQGFKEGSLLSLMGILLFSLYARVSRSFFRKTKQH